MALKHAKFSSVSFSILLTCSPFLIEDSADDDFDAPVASALIVYRTFCRELIFGDGWKGAGEPFTIDETMLSPTKLQSFFLKKERKHEMKTHKR